MKCKRPGEPESFRPPAAHALCHTPRRAACDVVAPNDPHLPAPAPLYDHLPPACAGPSDFPPSERGEGEGRSPLRAGDFVRPPSPAPSLAHSDRASCPTASCPTQRRTWQGTWWPPATWPNSQILCTTTE